MEEYVHFDIVDTGEGETAYEEYVDGNLQLLHENVPSSSASFNVRGRTYLTNSMLAEALKAVMKGKMNTNRAANVYGVPRSSLQRKVAQSRLEHKRKENKAYVAKLEAKAKKEMDGEEEEKGGWGSKCKRRMDEVETNVMVDDAEESSSITINDLLGVTLDHDYVEIASDCIIEENVDPLADNDIYLERREEEEDDEIPPPPQIGQLEEYEEEEVVVDELEEPDDGGMPQLDSIYEY